MKVTQNMGKEENYCDNTVAKSLFKKMITRTSIVWPTVANNQILWSKIFSTLLIIIKDHSKTVWIEELRAWFILWPHFIQQLNISHAKTIVTYSKRHNRCTTSKSETLELNNNLFKCYNSVSTHSKYLRHMNYR
jgi:hypothetical protein